MRSYVCGSVQWYTPRPVIEAAHLLMGGIKFDPCTNHGNHVGAEEWCTAGGQSRPWMDDFWCNPPYGPELDSFLYALHKATVEFRGLLLLGNSRVSGYEHQRHVLNPNLSAMLIFRKRLSFLNARGEPLNANTVDSIMYAYGYPAGLVEAAFGQFGTVIETRVIA